MNVAGVVALTALWIGLAGPSPGQLALGVVVAAGALAVTGSLRARGPRVRPFAWARLLAGLALELVRSNVRVAAHVVRPRMRFRPAILAVPLEPLSDAQIALLANMLTMTPGTAAIDVSADRSILYVHVLDAPDPDRAIREIKEGFERRVKEASR